jgi:hypothetical protein
LFVHACQRGIKLIIHNSHLSTPSPYLDLSNFAVSYAVSIRIRGQHLFFATNIESCYFRPCRSSPSLFHHHQTPQAATLCADSDLSVLLGLARQGEALAVSPLRLASASRGELSSPLQGRTSCGPWSPGWDPLSSRPGRAATAVGRGGVACVSRYLGYSRWARLCKCHLQRPCEKPCNEWGVQPDFDGPHPIALREVARSGGKGPDRPSSSLPRGAIRP